MSFIWETPEETILTLAQRFRRIRKRRGLTQLPLREKSNVSCGRIKHSETVSQISLHSHRASPVLQGLSDGSCFCLLI